jgi:glycosyltransferase involved in cell wall biosynthesis
MKTAVVVTPTIGKKSLKDAIESVRAQTYPAKHLLVIDGPEFELKVRINLEDNDLQILQLPNNVGGGGFYGHRVYAAIGHLVNEDIIFFLDEDNWYDSNHVQSLVDILKDDHLHFAHSLRKIWKPDGMYLCHDDCESLGKHPTASGGYHLIDTSSFAFKREQLINYGHLWHSGWGGDRRFLSFMHQMNIPYGCSGQYTLNYRLDGNPNSVKPDFFTYCNSIMRNKYPNGFPWRKT